MDSSIFCQISSCWVDTFWLTFSLHSFWLICLKGMRLLSWKLIEAIIYFNSYNFDWYLPATVPSKAISFSIISINNISIPRVWSRSEPVPFGTMLVPLGFSQLELAYFLLGLGWTGFRPDLVWTEAYSDQNTANGDGEEICKKETSFIS